MSERQCPQLNLGQGKSNLVQTATQWSEAATWNQQEEDGDIDHAGLVTSG